jgi:hypothetical protein
VRFGVGFASRADPLRGLAVRDLLAPYSAASPRGSQGLAEG